MHVVILAGGKGTRLAEETSTRPKPMIEIGGKPLLWHIMQLYAHYGFHDFLVACGYKGELIKEYFHNFVIRNSDYVINLRDGSRRTVLQNGVDWQVGLLDTGLDTMTGGRILRLKPWIGNERFMATYGDGLGDIDLRKLLDFHCSHGKLATVTAVRPPARFGELVLNGVNEVLEFSEKPQTQAGWINGGFFVFEPGIFDYLRADDTVLEREPLEQLAAARQLVAYRHHGFWQPMDTLREKLLLESLWADGKAPWKVWP
jgi:glucose-1-phosphate cytidylyltransferase